ncbi:hypothetical protein O0L34_g12894 [Tuta absoluta]|nr:hypothetical protein O0L34_g12894 [Tuta absoluta]
MPFRVRKKLDLRVKIPPNYPHDYAEMPPEVRRLTAEINTPTITVNGETVFTKTKNDDPGVTSPSISDEITYIDEDDYDGITTIAKYNTYPRATSPNLDVKFEYFRSPTPEIKLADEDKKVASIVDLQDNKSDDGSPIVYRRQLKRSSISAPEGLDKSNLETLNKIHDENNVSWNDNIFC